MTKKSIAQNIDIDGKKAIVLIASFFIFFVLPISVLNTSYSTYPKETESAQNGRVAGVETTADQSKQEETASPNQISTDSIFLIIGILSLSVTLILVSYLLVSSVRSSQLKKRS